MKKSLFTLFTIVFASTFIWGCKDDDNTPNRTELLTKAPWKKVEIDPLEPCKGDDVITYFKNGTSTWFKACEARTENNKWQFINNDTKLVTFYEGYDTAVGNDKNEFVDTLNIVELTESSLKVSYTYNTSKVYSLKH